MARKQRSIRGLVINIAILFTVLLVFTFTQMKCDERDGIIISSYSAQEKIKLAEEIYKARNDVIVFPHAIDVLTENRGFLRIMTSKGEIKRIVLTLPDHEYTQKLSADKLKKDFPEDLEIWKQRLPQLQLEAEQ